ncbi:MAG TPA: Xaa-Pro peptidase family protein [Vicinamibacterales bacterium]|nr:Xaa-Pro peptidase family protein [Vicinamibacterales bacterium]
MISRRSLFRLSALAGAAVWSNRSFVEADSGGQPAARPASDLPAPIAALTSMRSQAKPITNDERLLRIERAQRLMADNRIDALMLCEGTSLMYFTAVRWRGSERLFSVVLLQKGQPFVVCPAFEEDRAREQLGLGPLGTAHEVLTWHEHESPYALVAQGLKKRGIATGTLGVEETVKFVFSDGVAQAAPALKLVSGTPVTAGCRTIKDAHELALMRLASQVTLKAYKAAYESLREGMTQTDFARLVSAAHGQLGFQGGAGVQVGEFSALPHGSVQPQVIKEGAILLIDGGCSVEGYSSDISRTFVLGKATDKMKRVFDIDRRAQDIALRTARPGLACEAVDAAARRVISDVGFGPDYAYFTHRLGHGLGMDGHEWPYLVRGNTLALRPGMTFSNEPGIYIRGEFGVRVEDDMVITQSGAELFTPQSESLEKPF